MWQTVKGTYKAGVIELTEPLPEREGQQVLILFPDAGSQNAGIWQQIKSEFAREMPDLEQEQPDTAKVEFEALSAKVQEALPYETVEEFERAMRGDEHGLARY